MKKVLIVTLFAAVAWCAGTTIATAQVNGTVNITVNVGSHARLELNGIMGGPVNVTFADLEPTANPTVTGAPAVAVAARARTSAGGAVTLTVAANGDLLDGTQSIPIGNISWAANGDLAGGVLNTAAFTLCSWNNSGQRTGTQTYVLANSWDYVTGTYTAIVTYTLTAA